MDHQKRGAAFLLIVLIACALFSGCSPKKEHTDARGSIAWDLTDAVPEYLTQWPENAFTEKVTEPQSGTISYVQDHSASGRYALFIKDISAEECGKYIEELKAIGYTEIHAAANKVSIGTMLERDDAYLSIAYSEGLLGVLITLKENNEACSG